MRLSAVAILALHLVSIPALSQQFGNRAFMNVSTAPAGGYVTIDGRYVGTTPMTTIEVTAGRHVLSVRKEGFVTLMDTVVTVQGDTLVRHVTLDPACELLVESDPPGAAVHINNRFRGATPLRLPEMREGRYSVVLTAQKHIRWSDSVTIVLGTPASIHGRLQPMTGSISIDASGPDVDFMIDGQPAGAGPISQLTHNMGDVRISARERSTGETTSGAFVVAPGGHLRLATVFRRPTPEVFRYSLLFPGLGQMMGGQLVKGGMLAVGFAVAGILGIDAMVTYQDTRDRYDDLMESYRIIVSRPGAEDMHKSIEGTYDDLRAANRRRTTFLVAAAGIYVLSLVDAYFFHSVTNEIVEISSSPAGAQGPGRHAEDHGVTFCVRIPL
jgi:hypothetical protein